MSNIATATLNNILSLAKQASASGGDWVAVYGAIIDALSTTISDAGPDITSPEVTIPNDGVDPRVLTWLVGAQAVNGNSGAFADYIRSYTSDQYKIRSGTDLTQTKIQSASNAIAANVAWQLLYGKLPDNGILDWASASSAFSDKQLTLENVGTFDAAGAASTIFTGLASSTGRNNDSPWAGTVLFTDLGDPDYFNAWILDMNANTKDGGAKVESGTYDLIAAVEATVQTTTPSRAIISTITGQAFQLLDLQAKNASVISQAQTNAQNFFATAYGSDFESNDVGSILYGSGGLAALATSVISPNSYEAGTIAGETATLDPSTKVFVGGPGKNTVNASVVSGAGNYVIDGGTGTGNILNYSSNGTPLTIKLQNSGYWQLRLQIAAQGNYVKQDAYEFSALNLSGNGDKVVWDFGLSLSNVAHGTATTGGPLKITEKPSSADALNTVDLSGLSGNFTFTNGTADGLGATFAGFSTLIGPVFDKHTFNITPTDGASSYTRYESGASGDTFNVSYTGSTASPLVLVADANGGDTFNLSNADKSSSTFIASVTGNNTFNLTNSSATPVDLVLLYAEGLTESSVLNINTTSITNNINNLYGQNSNRIVVVDPLSNDIFKSNGIGITDPINFGSWGTNAIGSPLSIDFTGTGAQQPAATAVGSRDIVVCGSGNATINAKGNGETILGGAGNVTLNATWNSGSVVNPGLRELFVGGSGACTINVNYTDSKIPAHMSIEGGSGNNLINLQNINSDVGPSNPSVTFVWGGIWINHL